MRASIVALLALHLPPPLLGAAIRVPEDYPSVLAGVDAAAGGDSVLVGPGTWSDRELRTIVYNGSPQTMYVAMVLKPGVTVIGTAGALATTIDGGPEVTNVVVTVIHPYAGSRPGKVVGFTITGGGSGVSASLASPLELEGCRMIGNGRRGVDGRSQTFRLTDCELAGNEHAQPPPLTGALSGTDVYVTCEGCSFAGNTGPGLYIVGSQSGNVVTLRDCVFRDHVWRGAAIADGGVTIERCLFLDNATSGNGAGLLVTRAGGSVVGCTFVRNRSMGGQGGGAQVADSQVRVESNTFFECHADIVAGALAVSGSDAGVIGNIFAGSTGPRGAVRKTGGPMNPISGCNLFWMNESGNYFGEWLPAGTDVFADPLFCDPPTLNFMLHASSPAAPANSPVCGLIGAWDVGCGMVAVQPESWGRIKCRFHSDEAGGR